MFGRRSGVEPVSRYISSMHQVSVPVRVISGLELALPKVPD